MTARAVPAAADVDDDVRLPLIVLENGNSKKKKKNEEEEEEKERVSEKKAKCEIPRRKIPKAEKILKFSEIKPSSKARGKSRHASLHRGEDGTLCGVPIEPCRA